jgi:hypothetical protein
MSGSSSPHVGYDDVIVRVSSNSHVANGDVLVRGSSSAHVADEFSSILDTLDSSTPLFSHEYRDNLHDSHALINICLDRLRIVPK